MTDAVRGSLSSQPVGAQNGPMNEWLLTGGRVIDPLNTVEGVLDIRVVHDRIAEIGHHLSGSPLIPRVDVTDRLVMPGIVDAHVHLSRYFGNPTGFRMLAKAGVTTALDLAGNCDDLTTGLEGFGSGLTVGYLKPAIPGETIDTHDPSRAEVERFIDSALAEGAFGIKILGGHYPLTPEATKAILRECDKRSIHVAFHAGTTEYGSNLNGLRQALELADNQWFHLAHVNSYCRGGTLGVPLDEAREAVGLLSTSPRVRSESYMALVNGTDGYCMDGIPKSDVTKASLRQVGYPPTMKGLEEAILADVAKVQVCEGGETVLCGGAVAAAYWKERGTRAGVSFRVNPAEVTMYLATAKVGERFAVDAFATDGGGIPRNTILEQGLALTRYGALTLYEFVEKATCNGARLMRLPHKGHLGIGADADIVVVDLTTSRPEMTIAMGVPIMISGIVIGTRGRLLTSPHGVDSLRARGVQTYLASRGDL